MGVNGVLFAGVWRFADLSFIGENRRLGAGGALFFMYSITSMVVRFRLFVLVVRFRLFVFR